MMERYSEYKDSRLKWLGEIPSHWEVVRGLGVFSENKSKNTQLENSTVLSLSYGKIIVKKDIDSGLVPEEYSSYQIVRPGCIIVRSTDLQNDKTSLRIGYVCDEGIITSAYLGLQVKGNNNDKYLYYFLHDWDITKEIYRHGNGLRQSLSWNDLRDNSVLLPPLSEQDAIVRYLDTATSEIDKAIAMQQKMIDLLNERKQIIIQNAVTKGLDENVEMKESGVEWIGRIPKHWEVLKLKRCAIIKTGTTPPTSNLKYFENGDIPWFTPGDINDMNLHLSSKTITKKAIEDNVGRLFPAKSIYFVGIGATVGKVASCDFEASSNQQINAIMCNDRLDYKFATYCLLMEQRIIRETTNFVTLPILNQSSTGLINIVVPPKSEQQQIVSYLDGEMEKFDTAISNCQRQITLLQERKQIIINEVVTGKVRVS
jgi:type I restriction enzyme S subunit